MLAGSSSAAPTKKKIAAPPLHHAGQIPSALGSASRAREITQSAFRGASDPVPHRRRRATAAATTYPNPQLITGRATAQTRTRAKQFRLP